MQTLCSSLGSYKLALAHSHLVLLSYFSLVLMLSLELKQYFYLQGHKTKKIVLLRRANKNNNLLALKTFDT